MPVIVAPAAAAQEAVVPLDVNTVPFEPIVLKPVPPLAIFSVPARVTAPVVAVDGVNPVVPAEKVLTTFVTATAVK